MVDFVMALWCILFFFVCPGLIIYKYRAQVKRWIHDVSYGDLREWRPSKKTRAQRRIQKAQWRLTDEEDYLEYLKSESE